MRQREVLEVKEVYALTKDLRLMVLFDLKALARVARPKTLFQNRQDIFFRHFLEEHLTVYNADSRAPTVTIPGNRLGINANFDMLVIGGSVVQREGVAS
jgi:hypothetical protein